MRYTRSAGKMGPQLWHVGAVRARTPDWRRGTLMTSSGLSSPGKPVRRGMSEEDVAGRITAFGEAAADAKRLAMTPIELHGAHGYLESTSSSGKAPCARGRVRRTGSARALALRRRDPEGRCARRWGRTIR